MAHRLPVLPSVTRKLIQHGVKALQPQWHPAAIVSSDNSNSHSNNNNNSIGPVHNHKPLKKLPRVAEGTWHPAMISNRKARVFRKHSLRTGSYGTFDSVTGIGWDPEWDILMASNREPSRLIQEQNTELSLIRKVKSHSSGRYRIAIPKRSANVRNREQRAQTLEKTLQSADQVLQEYYVEKQKRKPIKSVENTYKKLMKGTK
jgi:hypothetical protein